MTIEVEEKGSKLKAAALCVAGWVVGYLISAVTSLLYFGLLRISPEQKASTLFMVLTALYGMVFAALGSLVGARFWRRQALGIGAAIAATIAVVALWSAAETPNAEHWTQIVAVLLMAPAAQFGAFFSRSDD
jgi:hypothetical protein